MLVFLAPALVFPAPALADALTAEEAIKQAIARVEGAEFEQALDLLRAAEQLTADRLMLSRIYLERGVVQEILKRPDDAIGSFFRSVRCDGSSTLSPEAHKASAVRLFAIAKALATADPEARTLSDRSGIILGPDRKLCAAPAGVAGGADPANTALVQPPPESSTTGPWIATGVTVVAATAGIIFTAAAASKDSECQSLTDPAAFAACDREAIDRERNAAIFLGAAAGAAAITAALWIYTAVD